ncbi:MAG: hypothetical protein ACRC2T_01690, partial [Thermoguttaceae bacterium]
MSSTEIYIKLLTKKNLISPELAESLHGKFLQASKPVMPNKLADRLVEKGVLSREAADSVLQELQNSNKTSGNSVTGQKLDEFADLNKNLGNEFSGDQFSNDPFRAAGSISSDSNIPAVFMKGNKAFRQQKQNPWESKLLLYGGTGTLLLLLFAAVLYYSIYRHGADEYMKAGDTANNSGKYAEAVEAYTTFLEKFPNHQDVSKAVIRRSLSKMRIVVEQKTDWPGALETAKNEIAVIILEPDYREEAQAEITAMLPTIAENLADSARKKKDEKLLALVEEALLLVQKHVPASSQPVSRLQKSQADIDYTKRELAKETRLAETVSKVESLIGKNASADESGIHLAYEVMTSLKQEYPGVEDDAIFINLMKKISYYEKGTIKFIEKPLTVLSKEEYSQLLTSQDVVLPVGIEILAYRKKSSKQNLGYNAQNASGNTNNIYVYAAGSVFAINSVDGKIIWRKNVGGNAIDTAKTPAIISSQVPGSDSESANNNTDANDLFVVNYENWELLKLDASTGDVIYVCQIGEPCFFTKLTPNRTSSFLLAVTESGKLFKFDATSGKSTGYLQLPQKVCVAPVVDLNNNRILLFADKTSVYSVPLGFDTSNSDSKVASYYLGHQPGTIKTTPVIFDNNIVVFDSANKAGASLKLYSLNRGESDATATPETPDSNITGDSELSCMQSLTLNGKITSNPLCDNNKMFLASDSGNIFLIELDAKNTTEPQLKLVAEGNIDTTSSEPFL